MDADAFSVDTLGLSATCMYVGVDKCLLVKNGGRYHVFLAHMEYLGEVGWNRGPVEFQM